MRCNSCGSHRLTNVISRLIMRRLSPLLASSARWRPSRTSLRRFSYVRSTARRRTSLSWLFAPKGFAPIRLIREESPVSSRTATSRWPPRHRAPTLEDVLNRPVRTTAPLLSHQWPWSSRSRSHGRVSFTTVWRMRRQTRSRRISLGRPRGWHQRRRILDDLMDQDEDSLCAACGASDFLWTRVF